MSGNLWVPCFKAEGGRAAIDLICSETAVDLVLIDVGRPTSMAWEHFAQLAKEDPIFVFSISQIRGGDAADAQRSACFHTRWVSSKSKALFPADMTRRSSNVFSINPARPRQA